MKKDDLPEHLKLKRFALEFSDPKTEKKFKDFHNEQVKAFTRINVLISLFAWFFAGVFVFVYYRHGLLTFLTYILGVIYLSQVALLFADPTPHPEVTSLNPAFTLFRATSAFLMSLTVVCRVLVDLADQLQFSGVQIQ